jgi:hypothetical protein
MIISTLKEFRLYVPSCAFDDFTSFQAQIDSSEQDVLKDKLGDALYARLCEYYKTLSPDALYDDFTSGEYAKDPWKMLLFCSQRIVAADAEARNIPKQQLSVNGMGVNVASSNDYDTASDKQVDKAAQSYKADAMRDTNILLRMLEGWAKMETTNESTLEIVELWKKSKYYYFCGGLIFPSHDVLSQYLHHFDNRYKFINLIPDIRFIQEEYLAEFVGPDLLEEILKNDTRENVLLDKLRKLAAAFLTERTTVLAFDKQQRQTAHNDSVFLRESITRLLRRREEEEIKREDATTPPPTADNVVTTADTSKEYKNNQPGSKIFVSPLLY